jgi:beta-phosphoglucomutase-like phosphatase (HAD superfamily)
LIRSTCAALLFDLDGTLTGTDALHLRAYNQILAEFDRAIDEPTYQQRVMGFPNSQILLWLFPDLPIETHVRLAERKEAAFRDLVGDLTPTEGLLHLLDWADAHAIPCCVVTNAVRANAELMLRGLRLTERFRAIIIGEDLAHGKPHPLPYLTGLQQLGADPARSVAFEDSLSGLRAAVSAGIACVGVTTSLSSEALRSAGASATARDFTEAPLRRFVEDICLG